MASHRRSRRLSPAATDRRRQSLWRPIRPRRLWFETLEDRRVLDAAVPTVVDLLPDSDSGLFDDDNLTNIRTATIEITAAEAADAIRVYRDDVLLGDAGHHDDLLHRYTFAVGQLVEGLNTITARSFDGVAESADSPPLVITLDTLGPRILAATPSAPFDLRAEALDSIAVTFSEPIDAGSLTVDDVLIQGPAGTIAATDITAVSDDQYQIHFAPQTVRGTYRVTVGPAIADLAGNLMDQNNNGTPGEATDAYQYAFAAYDADAVFTNATTIAEGNTTYEGQHLLINGTTVTINGPHNFGSVHLINGAVLTHSANTTTQTYKLDLSVTEEVIVDATSRIDVTGKGYLPGRTLGNTTEGAATGRSAGSYGGLGGIGQNPAGVPNIAYGDYADPEHWGSGGSVDGSGGAGGGLVRLVGQTLCLDGSLLADGASSTWRSGGGSGGGIYVAVDELTGGGIIRSGGGQGGGGSSGGWDPVWTHGGGGGGGRIAVYVQENDGFDLEHISAPGGAGSGGGAQRHGEPGTIHIVHGIVPTRIRWHAPAGQNDGYIAHFDDVHLHFNRPIDLDAFTSADLSVRGPLGPIEVSGLTLVGDRLYRIEMPPQSREGYYHFTVYPTLMDIEGFPLDQNANGIPGELVPSGSSRVVFTTETLPETDIYSFTLILDTTPPRSACAGGGCGGDVGFGGCLVQRGDR